MSWLKKLYIKYMKGARANNFPIHKYGLFFGKSKNPKTLMDAIDAVDLIIDFDEMENIVEEAKILAHLGGDFFWWNASSIQA